MTQIRRLVNRSGFGPNEQTQQYLDAQEITIDGRAVKADEQVEVGTVIKIRGNAYAVKGLSPKGPHWLEALDPIPEKIPGKRRVHCGYHKCLTMLTRRVFEETCLKNKRYCGQFRHFYHRDDLYYREAEYYPFASVSGACLDLDRFEDIKVSRFIRDPRDLVVSGYYYHKREAEHWCKIKSPHEFEWRMVNGSVPKQLPEDRSLAEYLAEAPIEEGLAAEIDFRQKHFESMLQWDLNDPRVRLYRYEEIVGNELRVFRDIFSFWGVPLSFRLAAMKRVKKRGIQKSRGNDKHIRDPRSGQWREHFTPALNKTFTERWGSLLEMYGYPLD
ncbi:MAG: sulfotransferase domain-containing protein [Verrucomicrobiota bacterium]